MTNKRARKVVLNSVALLVFAGMVFPVY